MPAGWYRDPEEPDGWRWWTGSEWTEARSAKDPKTRWSPTALIVSLILIALYFAYAATENGSLDLLAPPPCRQVVYLVEGTADRVDFTLESVKGNTEQFSDWAVPFRKGAGCFGKGAFYYISAQNTGESGTVICRVEIDGKEDTRARSSGEFVIATCSGRVP